MKKRSPKIKRAGPVLLRFRDEKNPDAKPSISHETARRLLSAIEAGDWAHGVALEQEGCTYGGCGIKAGGLEALINRVGGGINVSCRYSCEWFYSTGSGWVHVCYANCSGKGIRIEAVLQ